MKSLPPARQPRSVRPKIHIQPRSHVLVTISRHRGEHDSLSHALRHALQFTFDVYDNETEESWASTKELSSADQYGLTARGWAEMRLIFEI
jgi:hypothetical protein